MPRSRTPPNAPDLGDASAASELRDGFKFRSGRLALDLPATLAARLRAEPRDLLAMPHDLGRWLVAAGLASRAPDPTAAELDQARDLRDLSALPGNRLEALKGDRKGQYSLRINDQFRVCFVWSEGDALDIEIVDYH